MNRQELADAVEQAIGAVTAQTAVEAWARTALEAAQTAMASAQAQARDAQAALDAYDAANPPGG